MSGFFNKKKKTKTESRQQTNETITRQPRLDFDISTGSGANLGVQNVGENNTTSNVSLSSGVRDNLNASVNNSNNALGRIEQTITDLRSGTNAFVRARVAPLEQTLQSRRAQTERALSRRNVFGSLASNELNNFDAQGDRALADQRALATNEAINAVGQFESLARGVNSDIAGAARTQIQQELSELGINLEAIQLSMANQVPTGGTSVTEGESKTTTKNSGGILGKIVAAASAFSTPGV